VNAWLRTAWTNHKPDLLASALVVVLAVPFCFRSVNPLIRPFGEVADQRTHLAQLEQSASELAAGAEHHQQRLTDLDQELRDTREKLLAAGNVNRRIARLTDLAEGAGLAVDEIVPGEPKTLGLCLAVPVRLKAICNYPTCVAFLRQLKDAFPDTAVEAFELYGNAEDPRRGVQCHIHLLWHNRRR